MKKKVCLVAVNGKVSQEIIKYLIDDSTLCLNSGTVRDTSSYKNVDLGVIAGIGKNLDIKATTDLEKSISECDVIIDFSRVELSLEVLKLALKYNKPYLCGTTGFSENEKASFEFAGQNIPLLYSDNTSRLVNVMQEALVLVSKKINATTDIDIIEMHGNKKKDAPSGTSKDIKEIIEANELSEHKIETHSIRSGDIASTHCVYFGSYGERLELIHRAYDNSSFALGALDIAKFLLNQKPGCYHSKDVFK